MGYRGVVMQDLANVLPRITIPRTSVNKAKKKGRGCYAPALTLSVPTFLHLCFLSSYFWTCFLRNRWQRRAWLCPWGPPLPALTA
jgi:hypothetical protein